MEFDHSIIDLSICFVISLKKMGKSENTYRWGGLSTKIAYQN
jgi:hypothetical protein